MTKPAETTWGEPLLTSGKALVVLDTNVALDWLLFAQPSVAPLAQAVKGGRLHWVATSAMRDELAHVLGRGLATAWRADPAAVLDAWDRHAAILPEPSVQGPRCTDADDQKFIDLAVGAGARWLVSRDRAVLKVARRAALSGVSVVTPEALTLELSAAPALR